MNFNIYHKSNLVIQPTLLAQTIILRTDEVNEILNKFYGTTDVKIVDESKFFEEFISETSKEKLNEYFKTGNDIYNQLLQPTENFLNDASLALSLYHNTKEFDSTISIDDLKVRKPVDNIPLNQFQRLPFIYAHSFLDAVVKIRSAIFVMSKKKKTPFIPNEIRVKLISLKNEFDEEFPNIREVRHSWQHIEDRMRGKTFINNKEVDIKGSLLVLSSLSGDNLTYTIADGSTQSISISEKTFRRAEYYVQSVFDSFKWVNGQVK